MHLDKYKQYNGRLTTGAAAVSHPVMVRLGRKGIEIDAGLSLGQPPGGQIPQSPQSSQSPNTGGPNTGGENAGRPIWHYEDLHSGVPVTATASEVLICDGKQPGATLLVDDATFAANLVALSPQIGAKAWRTVGLKPALSITAAVAGFIGLIYATDYSPAKTIANVLPERGRVILGERVISSMTKKRRACTDRDGRRALNHMMTRLSTAAGLEKPFKVTVVKWSLVNAFAAPGGQLILTSGLIRKATSADMVAGVMAHEMGHGIELHPEAGLVRALGMSAAGEFFFTGSSSTIKNIGFILAALSYTRAGENEADQHALKILQKAGISSKPLSEFFDQLAKKSKKSGIGKVLNKYRFLSTHPPSPERAKLFNAGLSYKVSPVISAKEWAALRVICGKPPKRLSPKERLAKSRKRFERTIKKTSAILAKNPSDTAALYKRAAAYGRLKQYEKELEDLAKLTKLAPNVSLYHFKSALTHERLQQTQKAIAAYTQAIALAPKNSNLYRQRAKLLLRQKKWDEAIWDLNTAIAIKPKRTPYYIARAQAYRGKGDLNGALEDVATVLKIFPKSASAYLERGRIRAAMSQDEDAIADFSKAMTVASRFNMIKILRERGGAYERVGDRDAAISDYKKLLSYKAYTTIAKDHHKHAQSRLQALEVNTSGKPDGASDGKNDSGGVAPQQ